jgi:RHS repeat-associated protein
VGFYAYDANGNVTDLVGTNGTGLAHYEYDPFGNPLVATGTLAAANPFRFSTKYTDDETGLVYYGIRYYSPEMGRWLSRDPIGERGGRNLYGFVNNSPVNYFDPYGLWKSWTHKNLTKKAWQSVTRPEDMEKYGRRILKILKEENVGIDSGKTFKMHEWHFGRGIDEDIQTAKNAYTQLLSEQWERMSGKIGSPSKDNCLDALKIVGQLSHAWQDYYGHAVHIDSDGESETIGNLTGNPEAPGSDMKPASWGGVWNSGEHEWIEPGKQAPDAKHREQSAITWTKDKFNTFVELWWTPCKCYAEQMFK